MAPVLRSHLSQPCRERGVFARAILQLRSRSPVPRERAEPRRSRFEARGARVPRPMPNPRSAPRKRATLTSALQEELGAALPVVRTDRPQKFLGVVGPEAGNPTRVAKNSGQHHTPRGRRERHFVGMLRDRFLGRTSSARAAHAKSTPRLTNTGAGTRAQSPLFKFGRSLADDGRKLPLAAERVV
jgi:hypothetical protein